MTEQTTPDSLAETMERSLKTKDNALVTVVSGESKKNTKNKKEDPNQISIWLDKYENKLTKKRL